MIAIDYLIKQVAIKPQEKVLIIFLEDQKEERSKVKTYNISSALG